MPEYDATVLDGYFGHMSESPSTHTQVQFFILWLTFSLLKVETCLRLTFNLNRVKKLLTLL